MSHSSILKSPKILGTRKTGFGLVVLRLPGELYLFHFSGTRIACPGLYGVGHRQSSLLTSSYLYAVSMQSEI